MGRTERTMGIQTSGKQKEFYSLPTNDHIFGFEISFKAVDWGWFSNVLWEMVPFPGWPNWENWLSKLGVGDMS